MYAVRGHELRFSYSGKFRAHSAHYYQAPRVRHENPQDLSTIWLDRRFYFLKPTLINIPAQTKPQTLRGKHRVRSYR